MILHPSYTWARRLVEVRGTNLLAERAAAGIIFPQDPAACHKAIDRLRLGYISTFTKVFEAAFRRELRKLFEGINTSSIPVASADIIANSLSLYNFKPEYRRLYVTVFPVFAERSFDRLLPSKDMGRGFQQKADPELIASWEAEALTFVERELGSKITAVQLFSQKVVLEKVRLLGEQAIVDGWSVGRFAKELRKALNTIDLWRSVMIARTEVMTAASTGNHNGALKTGLELEKMWLTAGDGEGGRHAEAPEYFGLNFQTRPMNQKFQLTGGVFGMHPHSSDLPGDEVINCFPGDTEVSYSDIETAFRSWYDGEVVTIKTGAGYKLTGTPNHPALTVKGWVGLGDLEKGDQVLTCPLGHSLFAPPDFDIVGMPTAIEKVYNSLSGSWRGVRVSAADVNFHGDRPASDVDIIYIDSLLRDGSEPAFRKVLGRLGLKGTDLALRTLFCASLFDAGINMEFLGHGSDSDVSRFGQILSFVLAEPPHAEHVGLGAVPSFNTLLRQSKFYDLSGVSDNLCDLHLGHPSGVELDNPAGINFRPSSITSNPFQILPDTRFAAAHDLGYLFNRFSTSVQSDNIVSIDRSAWHDNVYTIGTRHGLYNAGGIMVRNCRCTEAFTPI